MMRGDGAGAAMACAEMQFHDAANIFPLDDENIASLADDIREHGQHVAIELMDGMVLDGRRRWLACKMAGIEPKTRAVNPCDPVAYVLSLNRHRRHLSESQLSMVAGRASECYEKLAKERQKLSQGAGKKGPANLPDLSKGDSRDLAGAAVGVSGKSVDYAKKVLRGGSEELIAAVDSNKVAVSTAARMAALPDAEQKEWLETAVKHKRGRTKQPIEPEDDKPEGERRGVGIIKANEAINCLIRIPKNDALRKRGFQLVTDWIRKNP